MIVKNEEAVLSRALKTAKTYADEIIVVDTGSTDKTVNVALSFTPNVFYFSWRDDFSAARNFAFEAATGDYVMWLDADDVIKSEEAEKIKKLKESADKDIYMFSYAMGFNENNEPTFSFFRERMIKRGLYFCGFVHEAVPLIGKVEKVEITVEHRKEADKPSGKRNLELYRKALKRGVKFCGRDYFYYSRELYFNGYYKKCLKVLKIGYPLIASEWERVAAKIIFARALIALGEYKKAFNRLIEGLSTLNPTPEYLFFLGFSARRAKIKSAEFFLKACFFAEEEEFGFSDKKYSFYYPALELCSLYFESGEKEKSLEYHKKLVEKFPNEKEVTFNEIFFARLENNA